VQKVAMEAFQAESLNKSTNPDEVVAAGASILGGILQGDLINVHLMDVTSHGFGVTDARARMETLIPKNTPIPVTVKKILFPRRPRACRASRCRSTSTPTAS